MDTLAFIFTLITALLHVYFLILEMFLWTTPTGLKVFHMKEEKAISSQVLAANQGLYNGMLAAGLLFSLFLPEGAGATALRLYCLAFVIVVGCCGGYSLKSYKVLMIQALPALIAFVASAYISL